MEEPFFLPGVCRPAAPGCFDDHPAFGDGPEARVDYVDGRPLDAGRGILREQSGGVDGRGVGPESGHPGSRRRLGGFFKALFCPAVLIYKVFETLRM